jgi:2-C-methyl-D-erythritol 2,4-cyclodiphosphate synthase
MVHRHFDSGEYNTQMDIRVGHGYDLHRLGTPTEGGKKMIIGGVFFDSSVGPIAHSDGDAVMHAVTDAILSAIGDPDLGTLFPNTNSENENRNSAEFLNEAVMRSIEGGWVIGNIDITVICDAPKISPFREQICATLQSLIGAPVNIKGKTFEGTSKECAIEVHAVALVQRGNKHE